MVGGVMKRMVAIFFLGFLSVSNVAAAADSTQLIETVLEEKDTEEDAIVDKPACFLCEVVDAYVPQGATVGATAWVTMRCDNVDYLEKLVPPRPHCCVVNPKVKILLLMNMSDDVWKIIQYPSGRYGVKIFGASAPMSKHINKVKYLEGSPRDLQGEEAITVRWEIDGEEVTFF